MNRSFAVACVAVLSASSLGAQTAVPIRELTPAEARTTEGIGATFGSLRPLPDGGILVNDALRRRVIRFSADLSSHTVVIDSASGSANSYGPRPSSLIPYLGDSSLFVDMAAQALLVIDGTGKAVRVMAAPSSRDLLLFGLSSVASTDDRGRLIYRGRPAPRPPSPTPSTPPSTPPPSAADSVPIVRADFETRRIDTLGAAKVTGVASSTMTQLPNGGMRMTMTINPLPTLDEWAVLSDGTLALVRGHDYHVDWIQSDGTKSSSAKLPFDWRRLTDDDKQRTVDSARAINAAMRARMDSLAAARVAAAGRAGGVAPPAFMEEMNVVEPSALPDYYPPFRSGAVKADADGNIWILPTTSAQSLAGELVYDVVNRQAGLVFRVRIPRGRSIFGFGLGGVVYLLYRDSTAPVTTASGYLIERTRLTGGTPASQ